MSRMIRTACLLLTVAASSLSLADAGLAEPYGGAAVQTRPAPPSGASIGQHPAAPAGLPVVSVVTPPQVNGPDHRLPYYHYLPRPHPLNACNRSRPAFGDADFSFQGFNDARIPC